MKALVNGSWDPHAVRDGAWVPTGPFRSRIETSAAAPFPAARNRYHLYVSYACPFAHRTILLRRLKKLEHVISMSVLDPYWGYAQGWKFSAGAGCTPDTANGAQYLHELYTRADPNFTGRVTVPVLWDMQKQTIVNNESADIIRMFNSAFDAWGDAQIDLYPAPLRADIDRLNAFVAEYINHGVYAAGFAADQLAYDTHVKRLVAALSELDARLARNTYLLGERLTEADWRLFVTLVRFDVAYYSALRCNFKRLIEYPNLWTYTRRLYRVPGVPGTVRLDHIKRHYHDEMPGLINRKIIPIGPQVNFAA